MKLKELGKYKDSFCVPCHGQDLILQKVSPSEILKEAHSLQMLCEVSATVDKITSLRLVNMKKVDEISINSFRGMFKKMIKMVKIQTFYLKVNYRTDNLNLLDKTSNLEPIRSKQGHH